MLTDLYKNDIPFIRGVIFLDAWDEDFLDQWMQQVNIKLENYYVDSIIAANYQVALDVRYDTSLRNTISEYSLNNYQPDFLLPLMKETGNKEVHRDIEDIHFGNHSFMLLTPDSIKYHMNNMVPHIRDWLVIGGAWGACTHCRPFNFFHMGNIPDRRFYIADWSMYAQQGRPSFNLIEELTNDRLTWSSTNSELYQLVPKNVAHS
jgi:hypothetical protein